MQIERETSSYNERRYGKPWIAKVTFENSKGDFHFGEWVGQAGESGLLVIDVEVGDIVARGQKDFRKPRNSAPDFYIVREGGELATISKPDAYRHYKAQTAIAKV